MQNNSSSITDTLLAMKITDTGTSIDSCGFLTYLKYKMLHRKVNLL